MSNSGIEEWFSLRDKAMSAVELHGLELRVQHDLTHAALFSDRDQCAQQCRADAASAPPCQHRHAADVGVGEQASRSDYRTLLVLREDVHTVSVDAVPFQLERDALLVHEYGLAYGTQLAVIAAPVCKAHVKRWDHRKNYNHRGLQSVGHACAQPLG